MSSAARRWPNHAGGDEISEAVVRCVERGELGDWATPVCDDDLFAGLDAVDVLAQTVLQLTDPDLGPRSGYLHRFIVATPAARSTLLFRTPMRGRIGRTHTYRHPPPSARSAQYGTYVLA